MVFLVWIKFIICALLILFAGTKLSKYGDIIAEKTKLGRTLIGLLLLAVITSLPELFTGISSVVLINAPDLAMGDVLGSCMFNLLIIAILDFLHRPEPLLLKASRAHIISAGLSSLLISLVSICILMSDKIGMVRFGWIGIYSLIIPIIYILSMRLIFQFEKKILVEVLEERAEVLQYEKISLHNTYIKFSIAALIVIGAGSWLPIIGKEIATLTNLGETFVGTLFLAGATSMPELVICISALRIGAVDMAIGNIFGSNLFDIVIIAIDDIFYLKAPILSDISTNHILTGCLAIIMTNVAIVGLLYQTKKKTFIRTSWDALLIILIYLIGSFCLFKMEVK